MTVLITGASGRIGKHLVNALLKEGENVRVFIREKTVEADNIETFYGDILDIESLKKAVNGVDVIYHLAAIVDYLAPQDLMYKVNVLGTRNLLEVSKGKKIIYLSTTAVMGKKLKEMPANENTPCHPSNYYGKTKLEAENLVRENGGIILRSADVIGPGSFVNDVVISKLEEGKLPFIGDGKNFIHYIHINDLIQALLLVKERGKPGEVYIVAGKDVRTQKDCWNLICKYLNVSPPTKSVSLSLAKIQAYSKLLKFKINKEQPSIIPEYVEKITANRTFDISKARKELGFDPKISYEEAAQEMVEEYKKSKQKEENITEEKSEEQS